MKMSLIVTFLLLHILNFQYVFGQLDRVAFTTGQTEHLHANDTTVIPFDLVISSFGSSDLKQGVFTCTEPGVYKFQVYSLTQSHTALLLELIHNDNIVATLWGFTDSDYSAAGNAAILDLIEGDRVWIETRDQFPVNLYGTNNEIYTTFTGVKIGYNEPGAPNEVEAVSVALDNHILVPPSESVPYNKVNIDTSNTYDPSTGIYTVPASGIYEFHIFSMAELGYDVWQELYHNRHYVITIYGLGSQQWCDDGNSVILHLKKGDEITVKAHSPQLLYGNETELYSSLTGVKLYDEEVMYDTEYPAVAFSAGLSHHATYNNGEKVIFDRIFIDLHSAYNHQTGEFVAPITGIYEFNYHALAQKDEFIWLELYHNYKYVNGLYDHIPGHFGSAGNAAVVELDAGDVVHVTAKQINNLYGDQTEVYCTFSGYLLQPLSYPAAIGK